MRVRRAMQVAQALYEGVDLGASEGTVGFDHLHAHRLDPNQRSGARRSPRVHRREYGEAFHGGRRYAVREGAQDAHEAIRPTSVLHTPERLARHLKREELRLYTLIWERFVASQMSQALFDQTVVDVTAGEYGFRATGTIMRFPGFTRVYDEGKDEESAGKGRVRLPELNENEDLDCRKLEPKQHLPNRRRDTPKPRWSRRSKRTASAGPRRTRRSWRRFRRGVTSRSKNGASCRPKSAPR